MIMVSEWVKCVLCTVLTNNTVRLLAGVMTDIIFTVPENWLSFSWYYSKIRQEFVFRECTIL